MADLAPNALRFDDDELLRVARMPDVDIHTTFSPVELRRLRQLIEPKQTISEPTDYESGRNASLADTASRTARGVGRGVLQGVKTALNPFAVGEALINAPGELATTAKDLATNRGRNTIAGLKTLTDPDVGGEVIGNLALGLAAPRVGNFARNAAVRTGTAMQSAGEGMTSSSVPMSRPGMVRSSVGPILRTGGRVIEGVGRATGGELFSGESSLVRGDELSMWDRPDAAANVERPRGASITNTNATDAPTPKAPVYGRGGPPRVTRPTTPPPSLEDMLSQALDDELAGAPAEAGTTAPSVTMTEAGKPSMTPTAYEEMQTSPQNVSGRAVEAPTPDMEPVPELGPDAYAGPERRTPTSSGLGPEGVDRRATMDEPITGTIPERAAQMRAENPNIDTEAAAMRPTETTTPDVETPTSTPDEAPVDAGDPQALDAMMTDGLLQEAQSNATPDVANDVADLGTPRVLSWKPGHGPSAADAASMSQEFGSREAARRLKTTPDQIKILRGPSASVLPEAARASIDQTIATKGIEYALSNAPNPLARAYILSKQ